jgi:hypothetical protein
MKYIKTLILIFVLFILQILNAETVDISILSGENFATASFTIWYPDDIDFIEGVLVLMPGSNEDGRNQINDSF